MPDKIRVGILGATGTVGQRLIVLLADHPTFEIAGLGASPNSAGKVYGATARWNLGEAMPAAVQGLTIAACDPAAFGTCRVIFSALDASVAGEVELQFASRGFAVFSNAKNHRMDPLVPLVVPTCNPEHLALIPAQQAAKGFAKGFLVTNANCASSGIVLPLAALIQRFGPIDRVNITTMQAVSGAGYPGVPSLDILDNVIPHISGEEDKLETEPLKILGALQGSPPVAAGLRTDMTISAACHRVPVIQGHMAAVSVAFASGAAPSVAAAAAALRAFRPAYPCATSALPSAPASPIVVLDAPDRPQPRLDRDAGRGMAVSVGNLRPCPVFHLKFTVLSHNTVLGAAGSGILNAEICHAQGLI